MAQITLRDYLQETEDAISSSRVDDALTHCQLMLFHFPEALEIQRLLGEVYLAQRHLEDAQQIFDWVLTNDPENVLAYCNRALVSEHRSEYDVALDCYQQAYELSRGNGQIREEFNRLSEKFGQKGFMFSRAGLARLYMRGDALSEAIQEWDAVLAVAPDRLDARTGLLETYWRAGLMENVEQLAEQILHSVPKCLKALLLQAHVISARDSQRAQELLHQAEALDPDLTTAQALFADALVSHPDDPFLRQLKKAPVLLPEAKDSPTPQGQQQKSFAPVSDPIDALGSNNNIDALALWGGEDAYGSNDTTLIKPRSKTTPAPSYQEGSGPSWGNESIDDNHPLPSIPQPTSTGTNLQASWNTPVQEINNPQSSQDTQKKSEGASPEPWELLQDALNQFDTMGSEPRGATEGLAVPYSKDLPLWENTAGSVESGQPNLNISPPVSSSMSRPQESADLAGIGLDLWDVSKEGETTPPTAEEMPSPNNWFDIRSQTGSAVNRSDHSAFSLESRSNDALPLADSSLEQLAQSNTSSPEVQNSGAFPSQSLSQSLPLNVGASPTPMEPVESPFSFQSMNAEKFEDDEESFFGPSWLKSLGATTMAEEETPATPTYAPIAQTPQVAEPEYADSQHEEYSHTPFAQHSENLMQVPSAEYRETQSPPSHQSVPETNPYESWSQASLNNSANSYELPSWTSAEVTQRSENTNYETRSPHEEIHTSDTALPLSSVDSPVEPSAQSEATQEKAEYNLMTTLEALEQSLWSKGFIPLEPNSLSSLAAQTQESSISPHDPDTLKAPAEHDAQKLQELQKFQEVQESPLRQEPQETPEAPSLTSALAQLGGFVKEPQAPAAPTEATPFETSEQNEGPSWLYALKHSPATPAVPATPTWLDTPREPSTPAAYADNLPQFPPVQAEPIAADPRTHTQPAAREMQQTGNTPTRPENPFRDIDGELEATMRRPAIRLQAMPGSSSPSQRQGAAPPIVSRSQSRERIERAARATRPANENLSYRERLVKGYQHQLVGDYDEAMQEYRIIIRSGTDLLGEVVSNVRALLKIAPNYSAGYRVLGDAYMRQGEYLQAMEAYNKALTMTKKVKSRT